MFSSPGNPSKFLSIASELNSLIIQEFILAQQKETDYQNTYVSFISCEQQRHDVLKPQRMIRIDDHGVLELDNADAMDVDDDRYQRSEVLVTGVLKRQKTVPINPLLLVCRTLSEVFEEVAKSLAATALHLDLTDVMDIPIDSIRDQWSTVCDLSKIGRLRISIDVRRFSQNVFWQSFDLNERLLISPIVKLSNLLMHFDNVVHREILFLLPDHGRLDNVKRAAENIGFISRIALQPPDGRMTQQICIARVCFREEVVVLNAATRESRFGVPGQSVEDGTKKLCPSICWAAYPKTMVLSPELLAPVQTWLMPLQRPLKMPERGCQCR